MSCPIATPRSGRRLQEGITHRTSDLPHKSDKAPAVKSLDFSMDHRENFPRRTDPRKPSDMSAEAFARNITNRTILVKFPSNKGNSQGNNQYLLHESLATAESGYFKQLFSSGLRESQDREVAFNWTLPFQIAFRSVVQYIYFGHYHIGIGSEHTVGRLGLFKATSDENIQADHIVIYVLADRLLMPKLKSLALERFQKSNVIPSSHHIRFLTQVLYNDVVDEDEESREHLQDSKKAITGFGHNPEVAKGKASSTEGGTNPSNDRLGDSQVGATDFAAKTIDSGEQEQDDEIDSPFDFGRLKIKEEQQIITPPEPINDAANTRKEIIGMTHDPRRDMQKLFVGLVHKGLWLLSKSSCVEELIYEGGPFALDLFTLNKEPMGWRQNVATADKI